jgi:hypothetical protein
MNMTIFNFQNMMDMHKGYAYQIFNSIAYGKKITLSIAYPPRTKPIWTNPKQSNLLGELNPNSMKNFTQLQHKLPALTTPPHEPTLALQN